jgi:RNA polymerase sigma-70 factor (ECF subfamily)
VAQGDRGAFRALYDRHAGSVHRFCLARLRRRDAAADAFQETFLAVWAGAAGYGGSAPVLAWILGIARRKVADQQRAAARRGAEQPIEEGTAATDPGTADVVEEAVDVWQALSRLPEGQHEAVLLTYGLGLSCEEAGLVMGVPAGTVKSRLHAARLALARTLAGPYGGRP